MADKKLTPAEAKKVRDEYNYILGLAAQDDTGSVNKFWQQLRKTIKDSKGDRTIIDAFVDRELPKIKFFEGMYGRQVETAIQESQPEFAADVDRAVDNNRRIIQQIADQYGIDFPEGKSIDDFARESWRNGWDQQEMLLNMRPYLDSTLDSGATGGTAADFSDELQQWSAMNGITLDKQTANKYIANMTLGKQSLDAVKQDLRETYLVGAYPAWADRIREGYDPSMLADPYRDRISRMLEIDKSAIRLDDSLLQRGMQGVGADGKPKVIPLYEFERDIRNDPRWQYTDNARATYSEMGDQILKMFGFR